MNRNGDGDDDHESDGESDFDGHVEWKQEWSDADGIDAQKIVEEQDQVVGPVACWLNVRVERYPQ